MAYSLVIRSPTSNVSTMLFSLLVRITSLILLYYAVSHPPLIFTDTRMKYRAKHWVTNSSLVQNLVPGNFTGRLLSLASLVGPFPPLGSSPPPAEIMDLVIVDARCSSSCGFIRLRRHVTA
ncbi:hypothetical protein BGZ63DRAFT_381901 [Mariannaea sp. PMI_226]|nr:hypothetical protein BGZ63DRAFT_381901 [Mariannaea sp. PMI_226]